MPPPELEDELRDAVWRKSSRSPTQSECVEVAVLRDGVAVRDSKSPKNAQGRTVVLVFTRKEIGDLLRLIKNDGLPG